MAPHSSTLSWKIPWTEEPGELQSMGSQKSRTQLNDFTFTFHFHALEKEMATQSSVVAWRIPGMGEPGGLLSVGSHRVRYDWSDLAAAAAFSFWLTSLCIIGCSFIQLTKSNSKFVLFNGWVIFHCIHILHLLYPFVSGHIGCFHVLAIVGSAAMNIRVHVSFRIVVFSEYMPKSGIVGPYDRFIPSF